jgi:hypothetical protein
MKNYFVRVSVLLALTTLAPAQEQPPALTGYPTITWTPTMFNRDRCTYVHPRATGLLGLFNVFVAGPATATAPSRVDMHQFDATTNSLLHLSQFNQATMDGDVTVSVLPGDLEAIVGNGGNVFGCSRPNTNADFVRHTTRIPGLPAGFSATKAFSLLGQPMLSGCTPTQVWSYFLDPFTWTVGSPVAFAPPLAPGEWVELAAPLSDPHYDGFYGWLIAVRDGQNPRQKVLYNPSPTGAGPFVHVMDSPFHNLFTDFSMLEGGTVVACCHAPLPTSQFAECILRIDLVLTGHREVSSAGGIAYLGVACPWQGTGNPTGFALLAIGLLGNSSIQIPGIQGMLGLWPGQLLLFGPQAPTRGIAQWFPFLPALPPATYFDLQALFLDPLGAWFGNTALIEWA